MNEIELLEKLIEFDSITPDDKGCMEFLSNLLSQYGFTVEVKEFAEGDYKVKNLYATYGQGKNLCFGGHIDVVPTGDIARWSVPPFKATIKDDKIYGRGTCDMKAGVAASIIAARDFVQNNKFDGKVSLLITSDEEGAGELGTKTMLKYLSEEKQEKFDYIIVGEPTCISEFGDNIKIGRRGSVTMHVIIKGTQGHVAYPELANNPIRILSKILAELDQLKLDSGTPHFDASNLEVTNIEVGNKVDNLIPAKASFTCNIRFNDEHSAESLSNQIKSIVEKYSSDFEFKWMSNAAPFITKPDNFLHKLKDVIYSLSGKQPMFSTNGGTSDARFFSNYGPVFEFGVTNTSAHKIDEYIKIRDLQLLKDVYYQLLTVYYCSD